MRETIERSHVQERGSAQKKHMRFTKVQIKDVELKQIRKENRDMTDYILYVEAEAGAMRKDATCIMTYKEWLDENKR